MSAHTPHHLSVKVPPTSTPTRYRGREFFNFDYFPFLRRAVLQGDGLVFVQSSTEIPGTRLNSSVFDVTTMRPRDRACPAII